MACKATAVHGTANGKEEAQKSERAIGEEKRAIRLCCERACQLRARTHIELDGMLSSHKQNQQEECNGEGDKQAIMMS